MLLLSITTGLIALFIGGMLIDQHTTLAFAALQPAQKLFDPFLAKPASFPMLAGPIFPPENPAVSPQSCKVNPHS
jgi:hypothetical protein